jgi:hypothetical protein
MSSALRLSLGVNLVLAGVVAVLLWRGQPPVPTPAAPSARPTSAQADAPRTVAATQPRPLAAGGKLTPDAIAQLEQLGIAHATLVNVVVEDHNRRSAQRVLALQKKYAPRLVPDREMRELARQNDAEQIRALKETFGEEGYRAWDKEQTLRNLNRARVPGDELPLSAAEAEQAYRLQKEYDEKFQELQLAMEDGVADKADAGALQAKAQEALDRELEKLLGKQRFDELRGKTDPTTEVFRTYGTLNPTADQAKAVVQADADFRARQEALTKQVNENPGAATSLMAELQVLNDTREANLRQIFGTEAYDNLQRQNDPTYQALTQFADAWELKEQEVQPVYTALHAFDDQASRMRTAAEMSEAAGQRVNWREINAAIELQRQQVETRLHDLIGAKRLSRLQENGLLTKR